ncbi:beta-N-acetylhexosaminidase [Streptomyces sp. CB03238]|uniref:beta-N-acetylhexosaminidase n=1 Tax=Streptomyces sp. CB03238 TaxID=1907777 RepID=UPI000A12002A|nr:beta-N-acetylhexosaminidase [Streptomyces sp. CB03238]ORT61948.1 beta-N-acetylhexosaminidase [Streptomyces sp. CB03238]
MDPVELTDLIPAPRTAACRGSSPGYLSLDEGTTLDARPGTEGVARRLRATIGAATGLPLAPGRDPRGILLRISARVEREYGPEGYRLSTDGSVEDVAVVIEGGSAAGVFWGAQTLRQLLGPDAYRKAPIGPAGREWELPMVTVEDGPRFSWRGVMLDVARHFLPKDDVLRYVDLLAAHKLNVLHLHLTDDQGWRIEIERYPRLTEIGAWRTRTKWGHRASDLWNDTPHGGYYTQDDIREIVAYAAERHIRVVPEIDIPGHSQAAIAAYPELGNTDVIDTTTLPVWDTWGINPNVLAPTDSTLRFYEGVLEEVLALFPSPFIHLGGDECPKDQWKASPVAQARIEELGLAGEEELQAWFIRHFDRWLADRGRRLIGWDEILEGGLAPGAAVSSWRGYAGGIAAAEAGHDVVMCPEQHVYLDHRQDGGADEPVPIGYVRTLEDVYRFEPVPPGLSPDAAAHVIGTQANVWTEVMESRSRVDYQVFPRLAAFAEVAWSTRLPAAPAERDFADFERRMTAHYRRLDALGVDYRPPGGPLPWQRRPGVLGRPIEGAPPNV